MIHIRLQNIIDARGITQKELSEITKLRPTTISELCNNIRTSINREHLEKVMVALGIKDIAEIIEYKEER
ncbi:transcriptional regulator with XRE-family HTH domain [Paenibacillus sp. PastF-3]|uniref:helix-turn-helix domain-containing protein n=1 Tax=Paenibacillus sp. PastF-3 TaxID=2940626 RepID=UPI002475E71E|nr:helix-turn-helix transcriptional regulator [Paenibacillus sp. PastF-3]MDH6373498.1 transcriptional regulator with XRE-family HTH domain [Paenibacillus sp. PastF-3]